MGLLSLIEFPVVGTSATAAIAHPLQVVNEAKLDSMICMKGIDALIYCVIDVCPELEPGRNL